MLRLFYIALPLLSALFSAPAQSAEPDDPLFASTETLPVTLIAPFDEIDDERDKEQEYEGKLLLADESGNEFELDARFEVRGNWRLNPRNCSYSQLWVDLRRGQLPGTLFENQNRLKLVVQCRRQDRYLGFLENEMAAYRIFSMLSDYHFEIRPLSVTYQDSESGESRTHSAFFIEHQNRLSDRYGMEEVDANSISSSDLDQRQGALVSLFMYMIGNTDFSLIQGPPDDECCHNAKLLRDESGSYFPIPYDFDASGLVDASYAPEPNPGFRLRNNRDRLYRGFCVDPQIMSEAIARFQAHQSEILALFAERSDVRFLEGFFDTLANERNLQRRILDECR